MNANVVQLVSDSGQLLSITGLPSSEGRFAALQFDFASGLLQLSCHDDSDEIIVESGKPSADHADVTEATLADLVGMRIEYAWLLTNHRGYVDAFQLRLIDDQRRE